MKIRAGFVSNSSSSSFAIINASCGYETLITHDEIYIIGDLGETEFGWGPERIGDLHSRINFAWLQADSIDNSQWKEMIFTVIKANSNIQEIESGLTSTFVPNMHNLTWGYIDHQSSSYESKNTQMFASLDTLRDFIFGKNSYIHLDNDN